MRLLLDADGIIKLYRAGVLTLVVSEFSCVIPQSVYDEVVTKGKAHLHQDAEAIETIITGNVMVTPAQQHEQQDSGLGAGELGILGLLLHERNAIVVSDDRRFLAVLATQGTPFLTPADLLVVLARRGTLTKDEAMEALDGLRPTIRLAAYWDAMQDLESGDEHREKE
ncbi:MAG: hypothetical protein EXR50_05435 [Dehalococcoidia bacterium]|nr:hypothetical protein [Dehalococcoidia bacterium]